MIEKSSPALVLYTNIWWAAWQKTQSDTARKHRQAEETRASAFHVTR
jgi:hypothetical protein